MPEVKFQVEAVLFDMDGTLVDSTTGVVGAWSTFAEQYPGLDVKTILSSSHGVRTVDNLRKWCGITDEATLKEEAARFERAIVETSSNGITILPGVRPIIDNLLPAKSLPGQRWTICTSATRLYATAALKAAGIETPEGIVTADDVTNGKPDPEPYNEGAKSCGFDANNCVVVEDAPAGVRSGLAAGSKVIGLLTTHSREQMTGAALGAPEGRFYLVQDLSSVSMMLTDTGVEVKVNLE
ncbi:hypothetical protein HYDPIDRAFT_104800 [Hydnomerulius pinastri MD-312]|nr:hypothetical protein HYDPIDRAFT_104800 [Hydnomerulius pinastri MD-312]